MIFSNINQSELLNSSETEYGSLSSNSLIISNISNEQQKPVDKVWNPLYLNQDSTGPACSYYFLPADIKNVK